VRGRSWLAGVALAAAGLQLTAQEKPAIGQTFRTATDVVLVDVSVRDGGKPVTNLRVEDFVLTDNGVRQQIESVEATAVPIDLTLVVDLSGNANGSWVSPTPESRIRETIQAEVDGVVAMLRPSDRVRVLGIDRHVQQLVPMSPVSAVPPVGRVEFDGLPAMFDTLAAALLHRSEPARRHVVVARTKGLDSFSSIDADAVGALAAQSDGLFHLVLMETAADNDQALRGFQCQFMGMCWPNRSFWVPHRFTLMGPRPRHLLTRFGEALAAAADQTGGALHKTMVLTEPTLTATFRRAFEDFRTSYVLRYTLRGVPRAGWHRIDVTVPRFDRYTVRARAGYAVEETSATPAAPALPDVPRTLAQLAAAYDRRAYEQFAGGLRQQSDVRRLLREFEAAGNPWPASPRREAVLALELAEAGIFDAEAGTRQQAYGLLARFTQLVRNPLEPDAFERYWHFAALALLQGRVRPGVTHAFIERALARFPDEPRFVLARAMNAVLLRETTPVEPGESGDNPPRPTAGVIRQYFDAAIAIPEVSAEARIRFAYFQHASAAHEQALALLEDLKAESLADAWLRYFHALFRGHALAALGRSAQALEAYRAAASVVPGAQSPRIALMNAMVLAGDKAGAEAMAAEIEADARADLDPWWMYWQGDYRFHGAAITRLREWDQ
jgi:VWFA-related protein